MSSANTENRIKWLDLTRAIAILCVIVCHVNDNVYTLKAEFMTSLGPVSEFIAFFLRTIGRIGVPVFLMITGYLLLDRDYDGETIKKFWKDKWFHLLICTWTWILIDDILLVLIGKDVSFFDVARDMLFLTPVALGHAWYMPMILGMYLLIPFVAIALKKIKPAVYAPVLVIFVLLAFGYPLLYAVNHAALINGIVGRDISLQMNLGFSGGAYGIYMIIGYLVKKEVFRTIKTFILWIVFAASFLMTVFFQIWMFNSGYAYDLWYNNILLMVTGVSVFEILSRIREIAVYKLVHFISYYSFGAYLVHNLLIQILSELIKAQNIHMGIGLKNAVYFVTVTVVTFPLVWIVSKIPKVGKYVFYLK